MKTKARWEKGPIETGYRWHADGTNCARYHGSLAKVKLW